MMKQQLVWWQIWDKLNLTLIKLNCYLLLVPIGFPLEYGQHYLWNE